MENLDGEEQVALTECQASWQRVFKLCCCLFSPPPLTASSWYCIGTPPLDYSGLGVGWHLFAHTMRATCDSFPCPESCLQQGLGLCSGHLPVSPACGLMGFWQHVQVEERQLQTAAWGHSSRHRDSWGLLLLTSESAAIALFSGLAQGNNSVVFTVGDGWAFSVPGASPHLLLHCWSFSSCPGGPSLQLGEILIGSL